MKMGFPKKGSSNKKQNSGHEEERDTLSLSVVRPDTTAPIVSSFNDKIRPLLDAIDKLRNLMVMEEGIQLPTIVVVGDQSSGKSSVLESLARISLPRGQGICTRVPLVMRLQHHSEPEPEVFLEYNGKIVRTDEKNISDAIDVATDEIAGSGKGISNKPLTLVVKKKDVPDLTMVDLPGITRVPVKGQPDNIYDQIRDIIMEYIKPQESIILNVLSASVDFPTCESIRMSQSVDKAGERTLAVVTKSDKSPEGLLEKVTSGDVNIGLGYVCVRNRIGDESFEDALKAEASLFRSHPMLSNIDKSMVGIPVLAQKLVQIQASSIERNLPDIDKKIDDKLNVNEAEIRKLPKNTANAAEAMTVFMRIVWNVKESLRKILLRGEFDEYPDDKQMHCTARLVEMLGDYSKDLNKCPESDPTHNFLMEEIQHLEEAKRISLPNFLPRSVFLLVLQTKVNGISNIPKEFVKKLWVYIGEVVIKVMMSHVEDYYQLQLSASRAGHNLIAKMKERSMERMLEIIEMEKLTDYTCDPGYLAEYTRLMLAKEVFKKRLTQTAILMTVGDLGEIAVGDFRNYPQFLDQAFDLRMMMIAYWKIVLRRLVDGMALHLQHSVSKLLSEEWEAEIVIPLMAHQGGRIERIMEESPPVAAKRSKLNKRVKKLRECKTVLATIMDRGRAAYGTE